MSQAIERLIVQVRDARAQADGATNAFNAGKMDWATLNTFIKTHRALDAKLRSLSHRQKAEWERELKAKYATHKR